MAFGEDPGEMDLAWVARLIRRDDEEDDDQSDEEDENESTTLISPARTSTSQRPTSTTSNILVASTTSLTKTSISSNIIQLSISSQTRTSTTSRASVISTGIKTTLLTSVVTGISPTQQGKGNVGTPSSSVKSTSTGLSGAQGISNGTTAHPLAGTLVGVVIALVVFILFLFALLFSLARRRKVRSSQRNDITPSQEETMVRDRQSTWTETLPTVPRRLFMPPKSMWPKRGMISPHTLNRNNRGESIISKDGVDRQERLARVRTDLLGRRELKTGLAGKTAQEIEEREMISHTRGSGIVDKKDRVEIQASAGMWEDPITIARRESRAESEGSLPRWRTPVSWVRDQRMRGWGRLSG